MNLTSKSRYALKIMMDLAHYSHQPLVRRGDIANRQGIPTDYLDQIMIRLRAGKLVESTRGRSGGYRLARPANEITMWDLFSSVEESMIPVECISTGHACDFAGSCVSKNAWVDIFGALRDSLGKITLQSLASSWASDHQACPAGGIRECKGGGKGEDLTGFNQLKSEISHSLTEIR
ncbi:MAG: Rrf2 family transcriptional regulator [Proteobacteria bacterium]|nr:Rrf2 family transcriptional regulator [Pseudomonadota bacterium]